MHDRRSSICHLVVISLHLLFLQDNGLNQSLALAEFGAVLRAAGHRVELLLGDEERHLRSAIRRTDADIAVIPCPVAGHQRALRDANLLKAVLPECLVVLAGTYATFHPELALREEVDAVCIGEAEGAVLELATRVAMGRDWADVPNLCIDSGGTLVQNPLGPAVQDLDDLPLPARDLYFRYPFLARLPWKMFSTGRGCVHDCSYCWNTSLREMYDGTGRFVRRKSPARAVSEVADVAGAHPLRRVHFSDDLFTMQPAWLDDFADLYADRVGLPFTCNSSVELVTDQTVAALERSGCVGVAIGVETGNEELRTGLLGKQVTDEQIRVAARRIKGAGLELTTYNMVGSPGETVQDVFSTIALNRELDVDHVRVNMAIPLPHTGFEETAFTLGFGAQRDASSRVEKLTRPEMLFRSEENQALVNLYLLFRLAVHTPASEPLVRRLIELPSARLLQPFRPWGVYEEKKITGLTWLEGLRFFRHVGDPRKRTANYVTLI